MSRRMPWLSVVIPTVGRATLLQTLESFTMQPSSEGIEILLVADTHNGMTPQLIGARSYAQTDGRFRWLEFDGGESCFGQQQRTHGMHLASAPYVAFSQDDNIATQGSLDIMRRAIAAQTAPRPLLFRFLAPWREVIWREPVLRQANIDADCIVLPRKIARQVEWGLRYEGDYDLAERAAAASDDGVAWVDHVVTIAQPSYAHYWWL